MGPPAPRALSKCTRVGVKTSRAHSAFRGAGLGIQKFLRNSGSLSPCNCSSLYFYPQRINGKQSSPLAASLCWQPAKHVWNLAPEFGQKVYWRLNYYPPREGSGRWYNLQCFHRILSYFCFLRICLCRLPPTVVSVLQNELRRLVVGENCKLI